MSNLIRKSFVLHDFCHIIVPLLLQYNYWRNMLHNPDYKNNVQFKNTALNTLVVWGRAIRLLVGDAHCDPKFLECLRDYCVVYKYSFNPAEVLSDVLGERYKAEHPEIN